jgi:hypothetical protein
MRLYHSSGFYSYKLTNYWMKMKFPTKYTLTFKPLFKVCYKVVLQRFLIFSPEEFIYDSIRLAFGLLHSLIKSASTDVIISNYGLIYGYSQIGVLSKFSDLWPIYWLGLGQTSVMSLDVDLKK